MQSARLKNIIILILALLNLFLLGSLASRQLAEQEARRRVQEQLVALFAADGVTLNPEAISDQPPPPGGTLSRDTELDRQAASYLLGEDAVHTDLGGGIHTYTSQLGSAAFRTGGSFDASIQLPARTDAEDLFRKFCRKFGYEETVSQENAPTAVRWFNGCPVVNCAVSLTTEDGAYTVAGTLLPDQLIPDDSPLLSSVAALTAFLEFRRETGAVVSAVTGMYPCYQLQTTAAAPLTLVPTWCVRTGTSSYYVNCYTGTVTHNLAF